MARWLVVPQNKKSVEELLHWVKDDDPDTSFWESIRWRSAEHLIVTDTRPDFGENEDGVLINDDDEFPENEMLTLSDEVSTTYFTDSDFDTTIDEDDELITDFKNDDDGHWESDEHRIIFYGPIVVEEYEG